MNLFILIVIQYTILTDVHNTREEGKGGKKNILAEVFWLLAKAKWIITIAACT